MARGGDNRRVTSGQVYVQDPERARLTHIQFSAADRCAVLSGACAVSTLMYLQTLFFFFKKFSVFTDATSEYFPRNGHNFIYLLKFDGVVAWGPAPRHDAEDGARSSSITDSSYEKDYKIPLVLATGSKRP